MLLVYDNGALNPNPNPVPHTSDPNQDKRLVSLPWEDLFYKPGLPPKPKYDTSLATAADALAAVWYAGATGGKRSFDAAALAEETKVFHNWSTLEKTVSGGGVNMEL